MGYVVRWVSLLVAVLVAAVSAVPEAAPAGVGTAGSVSAAVTASGRAIVLTTHHDVRQAARARLVACVDANPGCAGHWSGPVQEHPEPLAKHLPGPPDGLTPRAAVPVPSAAAGRLVQVPGTRPAGSPAVPASGRSPPVIAALPPRQLTRSDHLQT